jgi:hypothetical protein
VEVLEYCLIAQQKQFWGLRKAGPPVVESLMTLTLIIHVISTNKIPFLQSRELGFDGHNVCHHTVWDLVALLAHVFRTWI